MRLIIRIRSAAALALIIISASHSSGETTSPMYANPLPVTIADPYVLRVERPATTTTLPVYYMYGTRNANRGFEVFESTDLVNWTNLGYCYRRTRGQWPERSFWAPEVVEHNGNFYMYFVALNTEAGIRNICVAKSSSPTGPFTDLKAPVFPGHPYIDPHVFKDPDDGSWYIYVTNEIPEDCKILGAKLKDNMVDIESTFTVSMTPSQKWEHNWIEGAYILKHKGLYYMMYSGFAYWEPEYNIGYATASSPLGPYQKFPGNPIVRKTETVYGPGHHSVTQSPDGKELIMVYHRHIDTDDRSRVLAIDRMAFSPNPKGGPDLITCEGAPSHTPQPYPSNQK